MGSDRMMKYLNEMDKTELDDLINKFIEKHVEHAHYFNYVIIDEYSVLIKVYAKVPDLNITSQFTIRAILTDDGLEIVEVE